MTRLFLICTVSLASTVAYSQTVLPDKVSKYIKDLHLLPLYQVDTISKNLPCNLTTKSGWHVDYYARWTINDGVQLDVHKLIYNDSILHTFLSPKNFMNIKYDSMTVVRETSEFLFLKVLNELLGDNLFIVSKTNEDKWYQFTDILKKDFENNIFIQYSLSYCQASNIPYLQVTNIQTGKSVDIKFKNQCDGGKNNWCIDSIVYANGKLTVTATLTKKRSKKTVTEIQNINI